MLKLNYDTIYDNNILYFDNDTDFEAFALNPMKVCSKFDKNGNEVFFIDCSFSKMYNDAIECGKRFCIKDIKSHVNKDGLLGTRWATYSIPSENIEKYYGED